jgi:hypothetical protein
MGSGRAPRRGAEARPAFVRRGLALGLGALALLACLDAGEARAFVRSTTGNAPFFWKESCVPVTIYLNGFPAESGMATDDVVKSVTAAAHAWSGDAVTCCTDQAMCPSGQSLGQTFNPFLEIVPTLAPASATPPAVAWDARNSIIFRTGPEMWSKSGKAGHAYAFEALAVTTVTARSDGHIVDVDMEVNGVNFGLNLGKNWINLDPGVSPPAQQGEIVQYFDLQNALTHEFGHFIGLDHTCYTPSATNPDVGTDGKPRPTDNLGKFIPNCEASPEIVQDTVMFNVTGPLQTNKRVLSEDDILAVCTIYGPTVPHDACALDSTAPGCAVAAPARPSRAHGGRLGLAGAALAAFAVLAARRRARG